jgi:hypothetical protein
MFNGPVFNNEVVQANSRAVNNAGFSESLDEANSLYSRLTGASFELVPSSYKGGVVYSGVPNTGNGDITWTRGSDAWRTNSNGLIQRVPWNLVGYSEDFSNLYWSKTNVTVTADNTTAPNGTNTADLISFTTSTGYIIKTLPIAASTQYTFSVYLKNNTFASGETLFLRVSDGVIAPAIARINLVAKTATYFTNPLAWTNISGQIEQLPNDWIRVSVTATSLGGGNGWIELAGDGFAKSCFAWGIQLVTGSSALPYFPTTDRLNVPRLSYMYGSAPALLLEPQRTNLDPNSQTFTGWTLTNSGGTTVTTVSASNPYGFSTVAKIIPDATLGQHRPFLSVNYSGAGRFWVIAKSAGYDYLSLGEAGGVSGGAIIFNLSNGTISGTAVGYTGEISSLGNGWYKCSINMTFTGALSRFIVVRNANSTADYTGDGTSGVLIAHKQCEVGAYDTTSIISSGATVTRLADSFTRGNIYTNGLITAAGGTWFIELRNNISYTRDSIGALWIGDNSTAASLGNSLNIRSSGTGILPINKCVGGTLTQLHVTTTSTVKIAIKWNGTTADVFVNGVKVTSATPFTTTNMEFLNGQGSDVPKFVQQMVLFPTPLSDDQCVALTSDFTEGESVIGSYERYVNSNGGAVENLNTITNLIQNLK